MSRSERLKENAAFDDGMPACGVYALKKPAAATYTPPVQAVGVDLVDVERLHSLYDRWEERFLFKLFTDQELVICQNATGYRWRSLGGRFGAKEAVKKILASRGESAGWREIEVLNGQYGEPYIKLHGRAYAALERLGYTHLMLSISHDAGLAIATVVAS
jgi:holo-[acyl-carrier protein] synthase